MDQELPVRADYYLYGIELGIIHFKEAVRWADTVVEKSEEPSGEIIDLALSKLKGRNGEWKR